METKKNDEMKRKVGIDFGYFLKPAQQKEQRINEQAKKHPDNEATEILKMVEEKGRQIINEAAMFAEAKAAKILAQAQQEAHEIVAKAQQQAQRDKNRAIPQNEEKIGHTAGEAKNVVADSQSVTSMSLTLDKGFGILIEATKKAETESNMIIAQAKETGRQIISEATREKEGEAKRIVSQAQETGRQIIEEATRKAETEANKIVTQALQTGLNIIVEASRIADTEAERIKRISQGEPKEHRLIEEAKAAAANRLWKSGKYFDVEHDIQQHPEETKDTLLAHLELAYSLAKARPVAEVSKTAAAAPPLQTRKSIFKPIPQKTDPKMKVDVRNQTAIYQGQVELAIMPPIDFIQLERLCISLQNLRNIRILSTDGCSDGRTAISILLNRPSPLITDLISVEEVEEAFGEETLDSHPLGDFMKKTLPPRPSKRNERRRILLVLKKAKLL